MPAQSQSDLLTKLEEYRSRYGKGAAAGATKLLAALGREKFRDAESLARFHEALLFLRAFPQAPRIAQAAERLLQTFWQRVEVLQQDKADLSGLDTFELSGIAGTAMEDTLSFDVVRWLARRVPNHVEIAWEQFDEERALATSLPRFVPLLEEDGSVEADIPWQKWLRAARGHKGGELAWLIGRFEQLPLPEKEKAELYDALRLPVRWKLGNLRLSRTRNRLAARKIFYHEKALIARREVSLKEELGKVGPVLQRLSRTQGEAILELIREVMLVRYRELYGTTLADPNSVVRADVGRGVSICLWNLPRDRRLPLRAYVAGMTVKNGVPINYIEAIGLFEWIEVGYNTFYTYRNGETAWIYAQALRCLCHRMGATCISVYPYQLGHENEEAIESGAFWFYRKLGFRPGRAELLRLAEREEKRIAANPKYKTPARTLRRLAQGHVFYEMPDSEDGAWDRFSTRNLGLRVSQLMAQWYGGNIGKMRKAATARAARGLGVETSKWNASERQAFEEFALVLELIPNLPQWTAQEKQELARTLRAKTAPDEMRFMRLLQKQQRLRKALLRLGSYA